MNWIALLALAALFAVYFFVKRASLISPKEAQAHLKGGALVIDVRTAGEFVAGHLPVAVNLPVNEIETNVTRRVTAQNQVLLLHAKAECAAAQQRKSSKPWVTPTPTTSVPMPVRSKS